MRVRSDLTDPALDQLAGHENPQWGTRAVVCVCVRKGRWGGGPSTLTKAWIYVSLQRNGRRRQDFWGQNAVMGFGDNESRFLSRCSYLKERVVGWVRRRQRPG